MAGIVTLTPNPTLDMYASVDVLEPNHKLRTHQLSAQPGGGGINVAHVAAELGGDVTAVYTTGGSVGREIEHFLVNCGIPSMPVKIAEPSRRTFSTLDRSTGNMYRFIGPGPTITQTEWNDFLHAIRVLKRLPTCIVFSGSFPPGLTADAVRDIVAVSRERHCWLCFDTSGEALVTAISECVDVITPSVGELAAATGWKGEIDDFDFRGAARSVVDAGVGTVLVTLGDAGAYALSRDQGGFFAASPPVHIASTVGAGDSATAAFVLELDKGADTRHALQAAVAAGAAAVTRPGTDLCHPDDVMKLMAAVEVIAD